MNYHYKRWVFPCFFLLTLLITTRNLSKAQTCAPRSIPYVETFDALISPDLPPCSATLDLDGDNKSWKTQNVGAGANLRFRNENPSINEGWFFTEGISMEKDVVYTFRCQWGAGGRSAAPLFRIHWGGGQHPDSMQVNPVLLDNNSTMRSGFDTLEVDFTPTRTGTYYFGFYGYGDDVKTFGIDISVDDIVVSRKGTPLYDVAVTSLMGFDTDGAICNDTNANLSVVVTNTGILPVSNILVDVMYTGAAVGARSGSITGPLLAGESDTIVFANADLSLTGAYEFITNILVADDEVPTNDTLEFTLNVYSEPTADSIIATATGTDGAFQFEAANAQQDVDYEWNFGDGTSVSTASNPSHTYTDSGSYTVTLVISNICGSITLTKEVLADIKSNNDDEDDVSITDQGITSEVSIYPNPTTDWLVVKASPNHTMNRISVFNNTGHLVKVVEQPDSTATRIHTGELAAGIYLVRVTTEQSVFNYKLQILR